MEGTARAENGRLREAVLQGHPEAAGRSWWQLTQDGADLRRQVRLAELRRRWGDREVSLDEGDVEGLRELLRLPSARFLLGLELIWPDGEPCVMNVAIVSQEDL